MDINHINIVRIKAIHNALKELNDKIVFVGGATVSLYATRPSEDIRPTNDVDVLVEIANYNGYAVLEEKLLSLGFSNDVESGVICRYTIKGIVVDVMPTDEKAIGFSNIWYKEGFMNAINYKIDDYVSVKIFSPAYFVATKLEAFKNRGRGDGRTSPDFEDIVFILNNRSAIWNEMNNAPNDLKAYLKSEWQRYLETGLLSEWISSNLEYSEQHRSNYIIYNTLEFIK